MGDVYLLYNRRTSVFDLGNDAMQVTFYQAVSDCYQRVTGVIENLDIVKGL